MVCYSHVIMFIKAAHCLPSGANLDADTVKKTTSVTFKKEGNAFGFTISGQFSSPLPPFTPPSYSPLHTSLFSHSYSPPLHPPGGRTEGRPITVSHILVGTAAYRCVYLLTREGRKLFIEQCPPVIPLLYICTCSHTYTLIHSYMRTHIHTHIYIITPLAPQSPLLKLLHHTGVN